MNILNYNNQAKTQSMCQMKLFSWMCPTLKKCTKPRFCWMQNSADRLESWAEIKSDAWLHRGDRFSNFFPDIFTMQQNSISRNPVEKSSPLSLNSQFFFSLGASEVSKEIQSFLFRWKISIIFCCYWKILRRRAFFYREKCKPFTIDVLPHSTQPTTTSYHVKEWP